MKRGRDTSAVEFDDISRELIADIDTAGMHDVVLVGHQVMNMRPQELAEVLLAQLRH